MAGEWGFGTGSSPAPLVDTRPSNWERFERSWLGVGPDPAPYLNYYPGDNYYRDLDLATQHAANWYAGTTGNSHDAMMRAAYQPSSYGGGKGVAPAAAVREENAAVSSQPKQMTLADLLQMMMGGGSGGAAARQAAIEQAVAKINEDYQRQIAAIAANRDRGNTSINDALGAFNTATSANNTSYGQGADALNRAIADRAAQMAAAAHQNDQQAAARASTLGWNGSAIAQNAANNNAATANANRYSQDLANRFQQVQTGAQQSTANAGALMHQGALGALANNFASANNAAEKARSDATYQAQNPSSGGGGGGGGGTSMKDAIGSASAYLDLVNKFNGGTADPMAGIQFAMFNQDPTGYMANSQNSQYFPAIAQAANAKYKL